MEQTITVIKQENEIWHDFFDEGTMIIAYNYIVEKKNYNYFMPLESYDLLKAAIYKLDPKISEIPHILSKYCQKRLEKIANTPNLVYHYSDGTIYEVKECDIIRKHIKLGNIKADTNLEVDIFNEAIENTDMNYQTEDIVFKELAAMYMERNPDWKQDLKEYHVRVNSCHYCGNLECTCDYGENQ